MIIRSLVSLIACACWLQSVETVNAGMVIYSFTATDGVNVGTGTFSYATPMGGFSTGPNSDMYFPNYPTDSGQPPISVQFTSAVGTYTSNDTSGSVSVYNNDATNHDRVEITLNDTIGMSSVTNSIKFGDNSEQALSSTALPTSYNLASFPDAHTLQYYDPAISGYRTFNITSVSAVPEPSSFVLFGLVAAIFLCSLYVSRLRLKRAADAAALTASAAT